MCSVALRRINKSVWSSLCVYLSSMAMKSGIEELSQILSDHFRNPFRLDLDQRYESTEYIRQPDPPIAKQL